MLGLADYSSSDDSSNASVEHVSASVVEAQAAAAGQFDQRDTSGTVAGEVYMLDQQNPSQQSVPSTVRQFHHVQGQWALTAMLTVEHMPARDLLEDFRLRVSSLVSARASFCSVSDDTGAEAGARCDLDHATNVKDMYHVSLSRTQPGTFAQRKTLLHGLRQACGEWYPKQLRLKSFQVFSNDSASRTFLALMPDGGAPEIVCLIKRVDHVMLRHRLKQFYTDPHPHVSLLWWSGDIKETVQQHLDKFEQIWAASVGCWCCQDRVCSTHLRPISLY